MANLISNDPDGKVTFTLPSNYARNVKAGDAVAVGDLTGIAVRDAKKGETCTLITRGVAGVTAATGVTTTNSSVGSVIYAVASSGAGVHTSSGNKRLGLSVKPAAAGGTLEVLLSNG